MTIAYTESQGFPLRIAKKIPNQKHANEHGRHIAKLSGLRVSDRSLSVLFSAALRILYPLPGQ